MNNSNIRLLCTLILFIIFSGSVSALDFSDFEGTWFMSSDANSGDITITNATEKSFEFSFQGLYLNEITGGANFGDLEGTAFFTAKNKAVCVYKSEYLDDVTFEFIIDNGKLQVSVVEGTEWGLFGLGVYMSGTYSK